VQPAGERDLPKIIQAFKRRRSPAGSGQRGEEDRDQQGDNANHNEQFSERESGSADTWAW
jgi:hypothetical protein